MVKFFTFLFCVTQIVWGSSQEEAIEIPGAVAHTPMFSVANFNKLIDAKNYNAANTLINNYITNHLTNASIDRSYQANERDEFQKLLQNNLTPREVTITERFKSQAFKTSAGFTIGAGIFESLRFIYCTKDQYLCNWIPPVTAAIAGGNTALAFTQLTDNTYFLSIICFVAFCCAMEQRLAEFQPESNWKSLPGFLTPIVGGLTSFLGRKYLAFNSKKENSLSNYFTKLTSGDNQGHDLLSRYLAAVACNQNWDKKKPDILSCLAVAHLWQLEETRANQQ